uniref:Ubiquitin carboxyl-terminal hydrolase 36 n=1 Tax=Leptobrachium leishanense TaxID=445787 RepID=A0A8C5QGE0_9ANUR
MKWERVTRVGAGLQNLGNTCYVNSVLQCLTYTPPLANYFLSKEHSCNCEQEGFCMLCLMQDHVINALNNSGKIIEPTSVVCQLQQIASQFIPGKPADARNFLRHSLLAMHNAFLRRPDALDRETLVEKIFDTHVRSQLTCSICKTSYSTVTSVIDLVLPIKDADTINEALELYIKPENLNNCRCTNCNKVSVSREFSITKISNILMLCVNRMDISTGKTNTKHVSYPEHLNLQPYMIQNTGEPEMYTLYAALVHADYVDQDQVGHGYSYIKAGDGQWYKMNDSDVRPATVTEVLSQKPHLLFYMRNPESCAGPSPRPCMDPPSRPAHSRSVSLVMKTSRVKRTCYTTLNGKLMEGHRGGRFSPYPIPSSVKRAVYFSSTTSCPGPVKHMNREKNGNPESCAGPSPRPCMNLPRGPAHSSSGSLKVKTSRVKQSFCTTLNGKVMQSQRGGRFSPYPIPSLVKRA